MSNLVSHLFETKAVSICPENKPFWYTSGKIGPYYINSEILYGSKQESNDLLEYINQEKDDIKGLPGKILAKVKEQYNTNRIYKDTIDEMKSIIEEKFDLNNIDYISGGERRDWFFSNILANLLNKPHISIYKDMTVVLSDSNFENTTDVTNIQGKNVLHIADLITEASSYFRAWIPAIENINGKLVYSIAAIDRLQAGSDKLREANVENYSAVYVDYTLFDKALELGAITKPQYDMVLDFIDDPDKTMKDFLIVYPDFLEQALNSDEKTVQRARLLIDNDLYNLNK